MAQAETRQWNHGRIPILRSEIRALREAAEASARASKGASDRDGIGRLLAAAVNAGLALELGLKMFYLTYHERGGRGHNLRTLFDGLPEQIRGDIRDSYLASLEASKLPPTIKVVALRFSPNPPARPETSNGVDVRNAEGLIAAAADAFERGRYFYERVGPEDWAIIAYPIDHMLFMSNVLDTVYDEYVRRGGWR